ncbi:inhibitory synaptic factor 1 [Corythoichthys intestinalis]|uniref:inhibitory synaptic factor 1 n=1 Tax=Corythoichthys intestinalis TaxID=161448 RepID=UPI0025A5204B|nr:inhibitory synaptic factor 1 [Corythoichthys intestinalis]XP_057675215.1 inhibitory synaptic factor 1 [Corythoichthys intestinalis]XP_057675279.1 inhibitory synaptic factor 1 [Corythoichthys intestinalis]XP_061795957.1 inhibitory synaptic factor 1-like [Nerophis lumbriciformis]
MSLSRAPARDTSETPSPRERIRSHMKMVIDQLEGILRELKDVAKELREVVGQIDKLTSDFDFDLDPDDWTVATASSTSSSERGLGEAFRLDFLNADVLSDSWEFCGYLESASGACARTPSDTPMGFFPRAPPGRGTIPTQTPTLPPAATASVYSQMNGGLPIPNGPRIITPDSSSEEASSSTHSHKTRERVRFSDKILYHALCCDDDDEEEQEDLPDDKSNRGTPDSDSEPSLLAEPLAPKRSSSEHSLLHNCLDPSYIPPSARSMTGAHTLPRKGLLNPGCRKKLLRNSSTQTVSDKSTQTVLPYIPSKQKTKEH